MQKVVNVLAVASSVVSLAVVGIGGYVFVNKDAIMQEVIDGALGGLGGGLPTGSNDLPSLGATPTSNMGGGTVATDERALGGASF